MPVSDKPMAYKEFAAIKAQLVTELQLTPREWLQILGTNLDSAGTPQNLLNTSGAVTEASAAGMALNVQYDYYATCNGNPLTVSAAGSNLSASFAPWIPITPVTITADGAGLPPATEIVPAAAAGTKNDIMLFWKSDLASGAGQHIMRLKEDHAAAKGAMVPPWTAIVIPVTAGVTFPGDTFGVRMMNTTAAKNMGFCDGANGDWPNGAKVTFWGFHRHL